MSGTAYRANMATTPKTCRCSYASVVIRTSHFPEVRGEKKNINNKTEQVR